MNGVACDGVCGDIRDVGCVVLTKCAAPAGNLNAGKLLTPNVSSGVRICMTNVLGIIALTIRG